VQQQGSTFNEGWTFLWKGLLTTIGTSILQVRVRVRARVRARVGVAVRSGVRG
jgi:hypothetical protein